MRSIANGAGRLERRARCGSTTRAALQGVCGRSGYCVTGQIAGCLPAHAFTTLHYLVQRYQNRSQADNVVSWLLRYFHVAGTSHRELVRAQALGWRDFEDAVVAVAAETTGCTHILTRNIQDFSGAPVPALTPTEYLVG